MLYKDMDPELLCDYADWVIQYRDEASDPEPEVNIHTANNDQLLTWGSVL